MEGNGANRFAEDSTDGFAWSVSGLWNTCARTALESYVDSYSTRYANMTTRIFYAGYACFLLMILPVGAGAQNSERPDILIADFESENYGNWVVEGKAFGKGPSRGTLPGQMRDADFRRCERTSAVVSPQK